jgi:hypothetical protein
MRGLDTRIQILKTHKHKNYVYLHNVGSSWLFDQVNYAPINVEHDVAKVTPIMVPCAIQILHDVAKVTPIMVPCAIQISSVTH